MAKLSELAGLLDGLNTKTEKISTEVQTLRDSLGDTPIPAEAQESLDRLTANLQALDDLNADAPPPEPEPEPGAGS